VYLTLSHCPRVITIIAQFFWSICFQTFQFHFLCSHQPFGNSCWHTARQQSILYLRNSAVARSFSFRWCIYLRGGHDSAVGIAARYGLDGTAFERRVGARFSGPIQTGPEAHQIFLKMGIEPPSRGQSDWDVVLTAHSVLAPRVNRGRATPLYTPSHKYLLGMSRDSLYLCLLQLGSNNNFSLFSFCSDSINGSTVVDLARQQLQ
jgi:hypothetical protein